MPHRAFSNRSRAMSARLRIFFQQHPLLRQTLVWSVPAIIIGALLRLMLLSYSPYAYWGSDSKSYFSFAHMLLGEGYVSLDEKRRYLYPIFMVPVAALPGAPLKWLAWLQHALGLCSMLPLAYVVRKTMSFWKWWIIPVTALYVTIPIFLWYEHELLGEVLFFSALAWTFAGWVAWVSEKNITPSRRLFWWFFIPLAVFLLTKPSGRFVVPGIVCGLAAIRAWRVLDWRRWTALAVLAAVALTVGSKKQAAWLLYVASFPLTQLDSPKHADYKSELRSYAEPYIRDIDAYYLHDKRDKDGNASPFDFLDSPSEEKAPPLWSALDKDPAKKRALYMDLAIEGIKARPLSFAYLGAQRLIPSANFSTFDEEHFSSNYYPKKLEGLYEEASKLLAAGTKTSIPMAYGFPKNGPLPPYADLQQRLAPSPDCWAERSLTAWAHRFDTMSNVVSLPRVPKDAPPLDKAITRARPTLLGCWLMASITLAFVRWRTLGVWMVVALGYLAGVFLVSLLSGRYFAPAWIIFLPILFLPIDLALSALVRHRKT